MWRRSPSLRTSMQHSSCAAGRPATCRTDRGAAAGCPARSVRSRSRKRASRAVVQTACRVVPGSSASTRCTASRSAGSLTPRWWQTTSVRASRSPCSAAASSRARSSRSIGVTRTASGSMAPPRSGCSTAAASAAARIATRSSSRNRGPVRSRAAHSSCQRACPAQPGSRTSWAVSSGTRASSEIASVVRTTSRASAGSARRGWGRWCDGLRRAGRRPPRGGEP